MIIESLSAPWAWQENFREQQEVEMPVWPRHSVEVEGPVISILRVIFVFQKKSWHFCIDFEFITLKRLGVLSFHFYFGLISKFLKVKAWASAFEEKLLGGRHSRASLPRDRFERKCRSPARQAIRKKRLQKVERVN